MKAFVEFFTDEAIILSLCKIRAKTAKKRSKKHLLHLLTVAESHNYHKAASVKVDSYEQVTERQLKELLPSRRKWKSLGEQARYRKGTTQRLTSVDINVASLQKTILYYRRKKPQEPFVVKLNEFIRAIQSDIVSTDYRVAPPVIYPKPKDKKLLHELAPGANNVCRPISLFGLKDRVILSLTNRYLTRALDGLFTDTSFAFRAPRKSTEMMKVISHQDSIRALLEYRMSMEGQVLWVAECDMKKFYDSVGHGVITTALNELTEQLDHTKLPGFEYALAIFHEYLRCYSFEVNVLGVANDDYWSRFKIPRGEFGWVKQELSRYYHDGPLPRIGVPQGGALSGLIANIVLDKVDKMLLDKAGLFYARFCDDMIMLHPDGEVCQELVDQYRQALEHLNLVPHPFTLPEKLTEVSKGRRQSFKAKSTAPFWKEKSKGPYKWDKVENDGFPWIGFVGYEVHQSGMVRIRKSSLAKEMDKQKKVVGEIASAVKVGSRKSKKSIREIGINRLIAMSVGHVELWNRDSIVNEMCWLNGFSEINVNSHSTTQLKNLDRQRSKLIQKQLMELQLIDPANTLPAKSRQIIKYNMPFSYFYQASVRKRVSAAALSSTVTVEVEQPAATASSDSNLRRVRVGRHPNGKPVQNLP